MAQSNIKNKQSKKRLWLNRLKTFSLLSFVALIVVGYFVITSPSVVEKIVRSQFSAFTNGTIDLQVKEFSLFRGFVIEDVLVRSGNDFDKKPLLSAKRLTFKYYLPGFWVGDVGVHELGIYSPHIYLREKNGKWNILTLLKSSEKNENESEDDGEKSFFPKAIELYYNVQAFLYVILDDVTVDMESQSNNMQAHVDNFNLKTSLLSDKFHNLPLSLNALKLIDTMMLEVNPHNKVNVTFNNSNVSVGKKVNLTILLNFDKQNDDLEFSSTALVGENNIPFRYKNKKNMPFDFLFSYDMNYQPQKDKLYIKHVRLSALKDTWFNLNGYINNLIQKNGEFFADVSMTESNINLKKLYPYFSYFTDNKTLFFDGKISLAPFHLKGTFENLKLSEKISLTSIIVKQKSLRLTIPSFALSYSLLANLKNSKQKPIPFITSFTSNAQGTLNKAPLLLQADYIPHKKTFLLFTLKHLRVQEFAPFLSKDVLNMPFAFRGNINLLAKVWGQKETNLSSIVELSSNEFSYRLNHGFSPINRLKVALHSNIKSNDYNFSSLNIENKKIHLDLSNQKKQKALWLEARGKMSKKKNYLSYNFYLDELGVHLTHLRKVLPSEYQEKLESTVKKIPGVVLLKGNSLFALYKDKKILENNYFFVSEDLQITDVKLENRVVMDNKKIHIEKLELSGFNKSLSASVEGTLKKTLVQKLNEKNKIVKVEGYHPELSTNIFLGKNERTEIYPQNFIRGEMRLVSKISGNMIKGDLTVDHFYFDKGKLKVNDMNFKFPFKHNLLLNKTLSLTSANKERIIQNYNFARPYNLTIDSIEMEHPINKEQIFKAAYPMGKEKGISAVAYYDDNVFQMPVMQIYTLNGLVTLKNVLFNVGRGKLAEMEYMLQAQVKDTDLKQLIPPAKAKAIKDGAIHMDINFVGVGIKSKISKMVEEINGNVSVYKIGKEFGKQALKVVKPDSMAFIDLAVDQSIIVNKLDMDFKEGLVYARVFYRKGALGVLIGPAGNELVQERIPIPEYLQRARQEVEAYKLDTATSKEVKTNNGIF